VIRRNFVLLYSTIFSYFIFLFYSLISIFARGLFIFVNYSLDNIALKYYLMILLQDPELFPFRPIPLSFEPVEPGRCSPVLYSASISDMIDYSLRSCVERSITVRRCKNCGRYFPQTGRVSAEYCERPVAEGRQTCREAGAFQQWTKRQSDDPVFKAYRKEYKKRFAWIKAGRISDTEFYDWSRKAREKKQSAMKETSLWSNLWSG